MSQLIEVQWRLTLDSGVLAFIEAAADRGARDYQRAHPGQTTGISREDVAAMLITHAVQRLRVEQPDAVPDGGLVIADERCPWCGAPLAGIFASFEDDAWTVHGDRATLDIDVRCSACPQRLWVRMVKAGDTVIERRLERAAPE